MQKKLDAVAHARENAATIRLIALPWLIYRVAVRDVLRFVTGWRLLALCLIAVITFASFDPKDMVPQVGHSASYVAWATGTLVYVFVFVSLEALHGMIFGTRAPVIEPLYAAIGAVPGTWALWSVVQLAQGGGLAGLDLVLSDAPANYFWAMIFQVIVHLFVLPSDPRAAGYYRERRGATGLELVSVAGQARSGLHPLRSDTKTGAEARGGINEHQEFIHIGPHAVPLNSLVYVRADGHHVEVTTEGGRFKARARLRDVVRQIGQHTGFQPHRSWWVSTGAVAAITVDETQVQLELVDGAKVNVTRSRMGEFIRREDDIKQAIRANRRRSGASRVLRVPDRGALSLSRPRLAG